MFKKPLSNLKTSAPLRSSDRRKLKQRAIAAYGLTPEEGDLLVPEGILSVKFSTHVDEPGVAYLDPEGDPLWFTLGKGTDGELIPTIYTLWKKQDLLPFLSTPAAVVPILIGGADLMIPGVIHCPPSLPAQKLVSIRQFSRKDTASPHVLSPPVAVGWLALPSDQIRSSASGSNAREDRKGKAVRVAHTWKDRLWDMGAKGDMPEDKVLIVGGGAASAASQDADADEEKERTNESEEEEGNGEEQATPPPPSESEDDHEGDHEQPPSSPHPPADPTSSSPPQPTPKPSSDTPSNSYTYTPDEISTLLHLSLLQALHTSLAALPTSAFPIPATQFYAAHLLPARPALPWRVLPPSESVSRSGVDSAEGGGEGGGEPHIDTEISIKSSSYKSLSAFLKAKASTAPPLLTLKPLPQQKNKSKGDVLITSVNTSHPLVVAHEGFVTVREVEERKMKKKEREEREKEREERGRREVDVRELWRGEVLEDLGGSKTELYTAPEIRALLNTYIATNNLVNARVPAYINLDELLYSCVSSSKAKGKSKAKTKSGAKGHEGEGGEEDGEDGMDRFMKREELMKKVLGRLQPWYEIRVEGRDVVTKKGTLSPIQITTKMRQGRKACTLITGFEPFLVVGAEEMAEDLRRVCAGSTSVSPVPGKPPSANQMEVLVQGKQAPAVVDYLMGKGIPKRWIEVVDLVGKK